MRIAKPHAIELEYVQRMMAWMLWRPRRALGAGPCGAARPRCGGDHALLPPASCACSTTAVEINPSVIAACRQWFRLPADDARLTVRRTTTPRDWVADPATCRRCRCCSVDLYDHEPPRRCSTTRPSMPPAAACSSTAGVMTVNLFGRDASFEASAARIAARVRRRPGVEPAADARGQHRRRRRARRARCRTAPRWPRGRKTSRLASACRRASGCA